MKKRLVLLAALCALQPVSSFAASPEGLYVGANVGYVIAGSLDFTYAKLSGAEAPELEFDPGLALGAVVGHTFGKVRAEVELAWQKTDVDKFKVRNLELDMNDGSFSSLAFLVNGYWDFKNSTAFTPFVGVGLGASRTEYEVSGVDASSTHFAVQAGGGVSYAVTDKLSIDVKYRYFRAGLDYNTHNIYAGVRYFF